MTKDTHGIVYRREQCYKLLYITPCVTESQSRGKTFDPIKDKENYKKPEMDQVALNHRNHCITYIAIIMEEKIARVNWKRGQYSDVFRSSIIDPSPLKEGQKVQVLWGTKTKKELTAIVSVYPVVEKEDATTEDVLPSRRTKAKRKLVSNLFVVWMKRNGILIDSV